MENGLSGKPSSLKMIPSFIAPKALAEKPIEVTAIDAGGTNLRVAIIRVSSKGTEVIKSSKHPLPGTMGEVTKKQFFGTIADHLSDLGTLPPNIGFCFSYPSTISPERDGKLLHWVKEIKAKEVEGLWVGASLVEELMSRKLFQTTPKVSVLNDTVATLLAGYGADGHSAIGFILGTGYNQCYIDFNQNIAASWPGKIATEVQVINLESGNYDGTPSGFFEKTLDSKTANPGLYDFEKKVSGAYLGSLTKIAVDQALNDQLFSPSAVSILKQKESWTTTDLSGYLEGTSFGGFPETDKHLLQAILYRMVDRSALLTAISLTATIERVCSLHHTTSVGIYSEGSTLFKLPGYRTSIEAYLAELLKPKNLEGRIIPGTDPSLRGAAMAAAFYA
jgi:hexokinase